MKLEKGSEATKVPLKSFQVSFSFHNLSVPTHFLSRFSSLIPKFHAIVNLLLRNIGRKKHETELKVGKICEKILQGT